MVVFLHLQKMVKVPSKVKYDLFNVSSFTQEFICAGVRDNVIGMESKIPVQKATTGIGGHFEVPNSCKSILQMMVVDIEDGKASSAFKIKKYCNNPKLFLSEAYID